MISFFFCFFFSFLPRTKVLNPRNMMPEMPQTPAASQSIDLKKDRCLGENEGSPILQGGTFIATHVSNDPVASRLRSLTMGKKEDRR